jgi:hypothetical protein
MKRFILCLLLICFILVPTVWSAPMTYPAGRTFSTLENPVGVGTIDTSIFEQLIGKSIQIEANHCSIDEWVVRIDGVQGSWLEVTGGGNYTIFINPNYIQSFSLVKE